jgi:hypothetical protein
MMVDEDIVYKQQRISQLMLLEQDQEPYQIKEVQSYKIDIINIKLFWKIINKFLKNKK